LRIWHHAAMRDIGSLLDSLDGIARARHLEARGASAYDIRRAVAAGEIRRVRQGWYTTLPEGDPRVIAVAAGGRLTGAAALHLARAWMWQCPWTVDVLLPPGTGRVVLPRRVRVLRGRAPGLNVVVPLMDALVHAIPRATFEEAVALIDWGYKTGRLDEFDVHAIAARLPARLRGIPAWSDPRCDSFLESVTRTRLRIAGHRVTSQVPVGLLQRIDLVVDGVLGIETDGKEHHRDRFEEDRSKDLTIISEGRTAMRLSMALVRDEWPRVLAAVEAALIAHRGSRPGRRLRPAGMQAQDATLPPS
jgi:very-short-patch-repair endonuclease